VGQDSPNRSPSVVRVAGVTYCIGGLAIVAIAVLSAFVEASGHASIAGPLLVIAVLMTVPTIPACMVAQLSRYGRATLGPRGVRIALRGPCLLAAIVVMAPAVFVLLAVFVGHASDVWNRGGWALFIGGWTALVFVGALAVIEKQAFPSA
jgi:hypothetical protein